MGNGAVPPALARLQGMEMDGLVRLCGSVLTVTRLGRPFLRTICTSFDQHIADHIPGPRHASAI
jgi:hypothetical protein